MKKARKRMVTIEAVLTKDIFEVLSDGTVLDAKKGSKITVDATRDYAYINGIHCVIEDEEFKSLYEN